VIHRQIGDGGFGGLGGGGTAVDELKPDISGRLAKGVDDPAGLATPLSVSEAWRHTKTVAHASLCGTLETCTKVRWTDQPRSRARDLAHWRAVAFDMQKEGKGSRTSTTAREAGCAAKLARSASQLFAAPLRLERRHRSCRRRHDQRPGSTHYTNATTSFLRAARAILKSKVSNSGLITDGSARAVDGLREVVDVNVLRRDCM